MPATQATTSLACVQAHLFEALWEYLGGGAAIFEPAKPAKCSRLRQTADSRLRFLKINYKYTKIVQNNSHVYG